MDVEGFRKYSETYETAGDHDNPAPVMEGFDGELLANILREGRLSVEMFLKIAVRLAEALAFLHGKGIVHHRLNPEEIYVDLQNGEVELSEFNPDTEKPERNGGILKHGQTPERFSRGWRKS